MHRVSKSYLKDSSLQAKSKLRGDLLNQLEKIERDPSNKDGLRKKSKEPSNKSNNEAPSLFTWIGALISDAVMIIFYLALFVGFVYLAVKLVKYFWYV